MKSVRWRAGQSVVHMEVSPGTFLVELQGVDACRKHAAIRLSRLVWSDPSREKNKSICVD